MNSITVARWVSLVAAFLWGAVAEYKLAVEVGADQYTAVLLPLTLDVYGWAAMKSRRTGHVTGALSAMVATQTVSHLLTVGDAPDYIVGLSVVVSALVPTISLACHMLGHSEDAQGVKAADVEPLPVNPPDMTPVPEVGADDADVNEDDNTGDVRDDTVDVGPAMPVKPVDAPAKAETSPVDVDPTRVAAEAGLELIRHGHTMSGAADELEISRQWLYACLNRHGLYAEAKAILGARRAAARARKVAAAGA